MNSRQKFAEQLLMKEERISAWENSGALDRDYCELPSVEYWSID